MANLIKHRFVSPKADGADATQVRASNWNDGHLFIGGNAGDILTRDPTDATYGAKWAAPVAGLPPGGNLNDLLTRDLTVPTYGAKWAPPAAAPAIGVWQNEPFNAANFFAGGGMTWAVTSGQINANQYTIIGKTLHWVFWIDGSTLSGTMVSEVQMKLPGGNAISGNFHGPAFWGLNAGETVMTAYGAGGIAVNVKRLPAVAFTAGPLYVRGELTIPIL